MKERAQDIAMLIIAETDKSQNINYIGVVK